MKKKHVLISTLLALTAVCSAFSACDLSGLGGVGGAGSASGGGENIQQSSETEQDGVRYDVYDEGTHARVIGYTGAPTSVVIESEYESLPVTHILGHSFQDCTSLQSIVLPDCVALIDGWTFANCSNLQTVRMAGVTHLADGAFENCTSLTSVVIGNNLVRVADDTFAGCTSLSTVYYYGTASDWDLENIELGESNEYFLNATWYYYSEEAPTKEGNFWHYDGDSNPVAW